MQIKKLSDLEKLDPTKFELTKEEFDLLNGEFQDDLFREFNEKYPSHLLPSSEHILIYAAYLLRKDPTITPERIAIATIMLQTNEN